MQEKNKSALKNGVWIKEQNGILTMGVLGEKDSSFEMSEKLSNEIMAMEDDIEEALYGAGAVRFNPKNINLHKLFDNIAEDLDIPRESINLHLSGSYSVKGDYEKMYTVLKELLSNSFDTAEKSVVYISASVVDNKLCFIYRDNGRCSETENIKEAEKIITKDLNGSLKLMDSGQKSYLDIMIPEAATELK